ncbi:MAG: hypothetical protein JSR58_07085 [Verrucomicrobia bacterium]|nr:hypothetical protein [Verrucomicrobiota bacterium]
MFQSISRLFSKPTIDEPQEELFHRWQDTSGTSVHLCRQGNRLYTKSITNTVIGENWKTSTIDGDISWIIDTHVMKIGKHVISLEENLSQQITWNFADRQVTVYEENRDLVWQVCDKYAKRTTQTKLRHCFDYFLTRTYPNSKRYVCVTNESETDIKDNYRESPVQFTSIDDILQMLATCTLTRMELDNQGALKLVEFCTQQVLFYEWGGYGPQIRLFKEGEKLSYTVLDAKLYSGKIDTVQGLNAEQVADALLESEPRWRISSIKTELYFEEKKRLKYVELPNRRSLSLLSDASFWELVDKNTKTISRIPFEQVRFFNPLPTTHVYPGYFECRLEKGNLSASDCQELTQGYISGKLLRKGFSHFDRINFVIDCVIQNVETFGNEFRALTLSPVYFAQSRFDPYKVVDKYMSAITLVSMGADFYGHAALMLERFDKSSNRYVMEKVHFRLDKKIKTLKALNTLPGRVEVEPFRTNDLSVIKEKRETWLLPNWRVDNMMKKVNEAVEQQKNGINAFMFNIRGHEALLVPAKKTDKVSGEKLSVENCMTFARTALSWAGIELEEMPPTVLAVPPKAYMTPGERLKKEDD